jgi:outer membrane protein
MNCKNHKKNSIAFFYKNIYRYFFYNLLPINLLACLFSTFSCFAQQTEKVILQNYTRQQCVEYALKKSTTVANAKIDIEIAAAKVKENQAAALPQINASLNLTDNLAVQRMFFNETLLNSNAPADKVRAAELQTQYAASAAVSASQLIFNGSYFMGLKAAKVYAELAQKTSKQAEEETTYQVLRAYYTVLVNTERLVLFEENITRLTELVKQTKAMYENGTIEKLDLSRLEVSLTNLQTERERFANLLELSKALLKFQMGLEQTDEITLGEKIGAIALEVKGLENETPFDYGSRTEFALLQMQKKTNDLEVQYTKSLSYPSVYLFANGGANNGALSVGNLFSSGFYGFFNYGLRVEIPIFDGFRKAKQVQQKKMMGIKIENNLLALQKLINFQQKQAQISLKNVIAQMQMQQKNMNLAKEVLLITEIKYKEGVGSNLEVLNAESAYKEAENNYYTALYEALLAKTEADKAYARSFKP